MSSLSLTIGQSLYQAKGLLSQVTDNPSLEAEILLAYTLSQPRSYLYTHANTCFSRQAGNQFSQYIKRRLQKEPIAYILGEREFWSLNLFVNKHTLVPRPETELLVEHVLKLADKHTSCKVADLGTGCGAIALALAKERPLWQIYATDISKNALQIARKNAQQLMLVNVSFYHGNWCTALPSKDFDIIVTNPPYIAEKEWVFYQESLVFEPKEALVSGLDGLDAIRTVSHSAKTYLNSGGYIFVEHGFSQAIAVREMLMGDGYQKIATLSDLSGLERVTIGVWEAALVGK